MKGPFGTSDAAIKDFTKKFQDKTRNKWENRDSFNPVPGKYTMIEMSLEDEDETDAPAQVRTSWFVCLFVYNLWRMRQMPPLS
jgi:poly [ADP-ribose] polymerase